MISVDVLLSMDPDPGDQIGPDPQGIRNLVHF